MQRQLSPHETPAWKHSQYFFWHADFLQWHPCLCIFFKSPLVLLVRTPAPALPRLAGVRKLCPPLSGVLLTPRTPPGVGVAAPTVVASILGLNAFGFFSKRAAIACCLTVSVAGVFAQPWQLQFASQYPPLAKHSQYLLQAHCHTHTYTHTTDRTP